MAGIVSIDIATGNVGGDDSSNSRVGASDILARRKQRDSHTDKR